MLVLLKLTHALNSVKNLFGANFKYFIGLFKLVN